jgi:hypothetical protein
MNMEKPTEVLDYASMNESQLLENPVSNEVLQRKALEFLKTKDKEWFDRNFTGEVDAEGYLVAKDGVNITCTKPMGSVGAVGYWDIIQETKRELLNDPEFIQPRG